MALRRDQGYWPGPWPGEDGGPRRLEASATTRLAPGAGVEVVARTAIACTMVIWRDPGELFLLGHGAGPDVTSWVERVDPLTLATLGRSPDLPGGPTWPGGVAAHANGSLYVAFGRHVHRLSPDLEVLATRAMPRDRPYNSLVILSDGTVVSKDFGGVRPGDDDRLSDDCEVCFLDPDSLDIVERVVVPEGSVARLSADGDDVYVVGTSSMWRIRWDEVGRRAALDEDWHPRYRRDGEGFGWDAVIVDGSAWFLNNGAGTERYQGSLHGLGSAQVNQCVVRVGLADAQVERFEVHDEPGGVVANPPAVDPERGVVVGYDSAHGVVTAWDYRACRRLWQRRLEHGGHPVLFGEEGLVVLGDFRAERGTDEIVAIDLLTGDERARVDTTSPVQSVLFHCPAGDNGLYYCSFTTVARISFSPGP